MDAERLKKQLIKGFSRKNGRGEWSFNGREFETYYTTTLSNIQFWVKLLNDGSKLQMRVSVIQVLGKPINDENAQVGEFYGEERFEQGFEWLASTAVQRAEEMEKHIADASQKYWTYDRAATVAAMRLNASIAAEKYKED